MFTAKLGALFLAPCLAFMGFLGIGGHASTSPSTASSTATSSIAIGGHFWHWWGPGPIRIGTSTPATTTPPVIVGTTTPNISAESPVSGSVGTRVTLTGSGFVAGDYVNFGPGAITDVAVSSDGTSLSFTVPSSVGPYCKPDMGCPMYLVLIQDGVHAISVENPDTNATSNSIDFTVVGSTSPLEPIMHPMIPAVSAATKVNLNK